MAAVEIYAGIGATPATLTVSYTNQAGVAGRTGLCFWDGLANANFRPIMLQAGDYGVRSVENVQWSALTGSPGNFGITLYTILATFISRSERNRFYAYDSLLNLGANMPEIQSGACLFPIFKTALSSLTSTWSFDLLVGSDS